MESRISATGLKSVELDELTTNQIIINNEGLQYLHKYNILLPTMTEGYYNLQEELDNIMVSNTIQDLELIQLETRMSAAEGSITTLGAGLFLTSAGTLLALDLVNQKSWILFFQKPLRSDISSNVYLDFDTNYFSVDSSNNLTLNNLWKKDISNNLYFTSGKIGIGLTNPGTNYNLDVLGNINCSEIYRNGTPISSELSLFLPLTGGTLTGVLSGTTISATNFSGSTFSGSGTGITNLDNNNISINKPDIYTKTESDTIITQLYSSDIIVYSLEEREYPPKAFDSFTNLISSTGEILNINPSTYLKETITLDTNDINYGSGEYKIYHSSIYQTRYKRFLFNKVNNDVAGSGFSFNSATGYYQGNAYIKSDYFGEWFIIELPYPIILTRFIFGRNVYNRLPGLWRCYGSNDGIIFTEIPEASNDINSLTNSNYTIGFYEKILNGTFTISYKYIGFAIQKLSANDTTLIIGELRLFGKERAKPYYISSNVFNSTLTNYYNKSETDNLLLQKQNILIDNCISINNIINLQNELDKKATLISPVFVGTVVAPTPGISNNSTQVATTEFVNDKINELIEDVLEELQDDINTRATTTQMNSALSNKYDKTEVNNLLNSKQDIINDNSLPIIKISNLQTQLDSKATLVSPAFVGTPTVNANQIATTTYVDNAISGIINGAPAALDTLMEISSALNDDKNFFATINNCLATKAPTNNATFQGTTTFTGPLNIPINGINIANI